MLPPNGWRPEQHRIGLPPRGADHPEYVELRTVAYLEDDGRHGDKHRAVVCRSVDTLGLMVKNGSVTVDMAAAGRRFMALFRRAALMTLRASDPSRLNAGSAAQRLPTGFAGDPDLWRDRELWGQLDWLGWPTGLPARAAWFVLGCGESIREWTMRERWCGRSLDDHRGRRALIQALRALADLRL